MSDILIDDIEDHPELIDITLLPCVACGTRPAGGVYHSKVPSCIKCYVSGKLENVLGSKTTDSSSTYKVNEEVDMKTRTKRAVVKKFVDGKWIARATPWFDDEWYNVLPETVEELVNNSYMWREDD